MTGELRIPKPGSERLPAVILIHGSGGIGRNVDAWATEINSLGVAVFILDTFTGRGIVNTGSDQSQLGPLAMMIDAYRALARLAQHPRIDPGRIAVMGFSRGAVAAVYSSISNCCSSASRSIRNEPSILTTSPRMWTPPARSAFTRSILRRPAPCAPSSPN